MRSQRFSKLCRSSVLVGAALGVLGTAGTVTAQALKDVQTPDTPLVLKAQGSFFVGGEKVEQTQSRAGRPRPGRAHHRQPDVRAVHGAAGRRRQRARGDGSWRDPDGQVLGDHAGRTDGVGRVLRAQGPSRLRPGPGRARAIGFNQAVFNNVRAGSAPPASLPLWLRFSDESVWPNFRFGPKPGQPFSDSQFPVTAVDELAKQGVPDVSFGGLPTPNPTLKALSDLAGQVNGAVLMGHSQSGSFPLEAALLDPAAAKGLVLVEPGSCPARYTAEQIRRWRRCRSWSCSAIIATRRQASGLAHMAGSFEMCQALIGRLKAAGGQAEMLARPSAAFAATVT